MARSSKHSEIQVIELVFDDNVLIVEAVVSFTYHPAEPTTPPSYASGGDPPEGELAEIDAIEFQIDGEKVAMPPAIWKWVAENVDANGLCAVARDDDASAREYAAEMRSDRARED